MDFKVATYEFQSFDLNNVSEKMIVKKEIDLEIGIIEAEQTIS